jgi:hypothetical protein
MEKTRTSAVFFKIELKKRASQERSTSAAIISVILTTVTTEIALTGAVGRRESH